MSARAIFLCLALALAGYGGAYLHYARGKLALLAPRVLPPRPVSAGDPEAPRRLLLVGDSRIAQWPLHPPSGWRMVKLGFAGEAAVNIERAARASLREARADAVVIQAGANDATAAAFQSGAARARTLQAAAEAVLAMAAEAREAGVQRVIVLNLVPPIAPELWRRALMGTRQAETFRALSKQIESNASSRGFEVLDAERLFRAPDGRLRLDYRRNALHWSEAAYAALDAALFEQLQRPTPEGGGR